MRCSVNMNRDTAGRLRQSSRSGASASRSALSAPPHGRRSLDRVWMPYVEAVSRDVRTRRLDRSQQLLARARQLIPGASQTMSKGPTQWAQGVAPAFLQRGRGCRVWDVDGNEYLDFPMGLGPVILGYGHPAVNQAITAQLEDGITFTLPHPLEVDVAERIVPAGAGGRTRALRQNGVGCDLRRRAAGPRADRPRPGDRRRLSRMARLVHRHDLIAARGARAGARLGR